jgi:alcohol dehydrogenase
MACGDKKAACGVAVLDPELTLTMPASVSAATGIDAISHAVETYVTRPRNEISLLFSRAAWNHLSQNFARVLENPQDLVARSGMSLGACFAGLAIENSMLGATHALANPLTARFGIAHGQAIGLMLPHVIRFNGIEVDAWYHVLVEEAGYLNGVAVNGSASQHTSTEILAEVVRELASKAGLPDRLRECGVDFKRLRALAAEAASQWTGGFNPRKVGEEELLKLYEAAY